MYRILLSLTFIFISIFFIGCADSTTPISLPDTTETPNYDGELLTTISGYPAPEIPTQAVEKGYPAPSLAATQVGQGYPEPSESRTTPSISPTQDQNKGSVEGRLLLNNQPVPNAILSLAEVIRDSNGREMVVSYDPTSSPTTNTDSQGFFNFNNISPSKYGLILDTIIKSYLLHYPDDADSQILMEVKKGKTVDLGDLNFDSLPIQFP